MTAEAQIAINKLQINDIQGAKYEMAKHINKITSKHTHTEEYNKKLHATRPNCI